MDRREGMGISRIMFHVGLTHAQAKVYLFDLIEKGFLEYTSLGRNFYHTTPRGAQYLARINSMTEMLQANELAK
jgi:predicted transcriptional regulator